MRHLQGQRKGRAVARITAFLQSHGAVGVPFYIVYPAGGGEGEVLPTVLTDGIVVDALGRATGPDART